MKRLLILIGESSRLALKDFRVNGQVVLTLWEWSWMFNVVLFIYRHVYNLHIS
jgi:hypothetical protein